jgi:hypothetical protein
VPTYFATAAKFRAWLQKNAAKEAALLVGFYKTDSGQAQHEPGRSRSTKLCASGGSTASASGSTT